MATAVEMYDAMGNRLGFLYSEQSQFSKEKDAYLQEAKRLEELLKRTRNELVGYLLSDLHDSDIVALEKRLSYPMLHPIKEKYERLLAEAQAKKKELDERDEIKNYEFHHGNIEDEIKTHQDARDDLKAKLSRWEQNIWFVRLRYRKYFDEGYRPGLWTWLSNWRSVSFLMTDFKKQYQIKYRNATEVKEAYGKLKSDSDTISEMYEELNRRKAAIEELKATYDGLVKAPDDLFHKMYLEMGDAILAHFESCPEEFRGELSKGDKNLGIFLKKMSGLKKQVQYLREIVINRIDPVLSSLDAQLAKLGKKRSKVLRKLGFTDAELDGIRKLDEGKWSGRREKLARLRQRIGDFNRYENGSFSDKFLWWALITNMAVGQDIQEVRTFYERHPDWDYRTHRDPWEPAGTSRPDHALDAAAPDMALEMASTEDDSLQSDAS
jgi:hypothetical protein